MAKASSLLSDITSVFTKLSSAEQKVRKALSQKGLFLDQHDFDIMAVFNQELSDSYFDESEQDKQDVDSDREFEKIYVENFDSNSEKSKLKCEKRPRFDPEKFSLRSTPISSEQILNMYCSKCKPCVNLVKFSPSSNGFEYKSHVSGATYRSHTSFNAQGKSSRMLFVDDANPAKHRYDFNPFAGIEHGTRLEHGYESHGSDSMMSRSELLRSVSMPMPHHSDSEEHLVPPPGLSRQPFSSMMIMNHNQQSGYTNPLENIDIKQAESKSDPKIFNSFMPARFPDRNFEEI